MKQRAGTAGIAERLAREWERIIKQEWFVKTVEIAASMLAGFMAAAARLELGGTVFAPFGAAFAAAAMSELSFCRECGYAPAAGAVIGYVATAGTLSNMKYLAVMALMLALRGFLSVSPKLKQSAVLPCVISAVSVFFVSAAFSIMFGSTVYDVMLSLCEACVAGGVSFFFLRAMLSTDSNESKPRLTAVTNAQQRVCVAVSAAILLVGLSSVEIATISVGRVLGAAAVMFCAYVWRESGGAVAGIAAGLACALPALSSGTDSAGFAMLLAAFSFGGLTSGVFSSFGKLGIAISFVSIGAVCTAVFGADWLQPLIEICIGAVFLLMIPSAAAKKLAVSSEKSDTLDTRQVRELSIARLELAAASLKDVAQTTRMVNEKIEKYCKKSIMSDVFDRVADSFCRGCYKNVRCWQAEYSNTMNTMNGLAEQLKGAGKVSLKDMPEYFVKNCTAPERLINEINLRYNERLTENSADIRVSRVRSVVTEQFKGMADMLLKLSQELAEVRDIDITSAKLLRETAEKYLLAPLDTVCYTDASGRFSAELEIPEYKLNRVDKNELTAELCDLLGYELSAPNIRASGGAVRLIFRERGNYLITSAYRQYSVSGEKFCGDACGNFSDISGREFLLISDGMGSGSYASLDSSMASGLLHRMVTSGFDMDSALEMINCAMLVKSGEESLATVDAAGIDLFSGRVEFYKAGAAPSYIRRGGRVIKIESSSMPAGILGGIGFERSSFILKDGDLLLMISDGALGDGNGEWIASEFELRAGESLGEAAQRIVDCARSRVLPGHEDDISVMMARIDSAKS